MDDSMTSREFDLAAEIGDARRYRYLRDTHRDDTYDRVMAAHGDGADKWDKMIDEAIAGTDV